MGRRLAAPSARTRSKPLDGTLRDGSGAPQPRTIGRIEAGIRGRDCARAITRAPTSVTVQRSSFSVSRRQLLRISRKLCASIPTPMRETFTGRWGCATFRSTTPTGRSGSSRRRAGNTRGYYVHMSLVGAFGLKGNNIKDAQAALPPALALERKLIR